MKAVPYGADDWVTATPITDDMYSVGFKIAPLDVIAAECPRGTRADVPDGWEGRFWLAATPDNGGYTLWSDDEGHWLRVDSEPI